MHQLVSGSQFERRLQRVWLPLSLNGSLVRKSLNFGKSFTDGWRMSVLFANNYCCNIWCFPAGFSSLLQFMFICGYWRVASLDSLHFLSNAIFPCAWRWCSPKHVYHIDILIVCIAVQVHTLELRFTVACWDVLPYLHQCTWHFQYFGFL